MNVKGTVVARIAAGAVSASVLAAPAVGQSKAPSAIDKVTISGWALNMSNVATGVNQTIQITINTWSNPSQRQHLIPAHRHHHSARDRLEPVRLNNLVLETKKP
jgi:hypothetical protein